jgi:hypothetical protein
MSTRAREAGLALLLAGCLLAEESRACSVPVFRYALERWAPDAYQAVILHRGSLSEAEQALVTRLAAAESERHANLSALAVDLAQATEARWQQLREFVAEQPLPCLVLLYPEGSAVGGPAWVGPLNEQTVERVLQSPTRRMLSDRLAAGQSAVWLLLESGDPAKDDAAARVLEERLQHLAKTLELPELAKEDLGLLSIPGAQLRVDFSVLRVARTNDAESVLVRMLMGSEDDLKGLAEPLAFPVFGRGRALYAVVGPGINDENIDEACSFLTGPCSCQVKELNPGKFAIDHEAPPLTGLAGFAEPEPVEGERSGRSPAVQPSSTNQPDALVRTQAESPGDPAPAGRPWVGRSLAWAIVGAGVVGLLAVVALSILLLRHRR